MYFSYITFAAKKVGKGSDIDNSQKIKKKQF
jgi:hypothetical protein